MSTTLTPTLLRAKDDYAISRFYDTHALTMEARIAVGMIERWGAVAGTTDGEDSAGRQRFRLVTPEELVARAFDTARLVIAEAVTRGLLVETPQETPAEKERRAQEARVAVEAVRAESRAPAKSL